MIGTSRLAKCRLPFSLDRFGRRLTSQYDEDGIIYELIRLLDTPRYFVEFGAHPAECNCLALSTAWPGLFMDGADWGKLFIKREFITPANINQLLDKYDVPSEIGVLSIDIDGQELWVWQAIERSAAITVVEYNPQLGPDVSVSVARDDRFVWDYSVYQGASLKAHTKLADQKDLQLVYANGQNAFFVDRTLFDNHDDFKYEEMWRPSLANHPPDKLHRKWIEF